MFPVDVTCRLVQAGGRYTLSILAESTTNETEDFLWAQYMNFPTSKAAMSCFFSLIDHPNQLWNKNPYGHPLSIPH